MKKIYECGGKYFKETYTLKVVFNIQIDKQKDKWTFR